MSMTLATSRILAPNNFAICRALVHHASRFAIDCLKKS
jgi:hypothetical protein